MANIFMTEPYTKELLEKTSRSFDCGNSYLTEFIKDTRSLDFSAYKTYVLVSSDRTHIIGYYSLSMSYIEEIGAKIPLRIAGAAHIDMFAVDVKYQGTPTISGMKASDFLLNDCIDRIEYIRKEHISCAFVTLYSTEKGHSLYLRHGFEEPDEDMYFSRSYAEKQCIPMYLPLDYE